MLACRKLACNACADILNKDVGTVAPSWLSVVRLQNLVYIIICFLRSVNMFCNEQFVVTYIIGAAPTLIGGKQIGLSCFYINRQNLICAVGPRKSHPGTAAILSAISESPFFFPLGRAAICMP